MKVHPFTIVMLLFAVLHALPDCLIVPNSVGLSNGTNGCICFSGFVWNGTACALSSIANPPSNFQYDCNKVQHAVGTEGLTGCKCSSGYYWNATACWRNCSTEPNSLAFSLLAEQCACVQWYRWNGSACTKSASTPANYVPSYTEIPIEPVPPELQVIVKKALDCKTTPHSSGTNNGLEACFCIDGYQWSKEFNSCIQISNEPFIAPEQDTGLPLRPCFYLSGLRICPRPRRYRRNRFVVLFPNS